MILRATHVVQLQYFLMDTAKRYGLCAEPADPAANEQLASAAGLDYALLVSSQLADADVSSDTPEIVSAREALGRAATAALAFCERMLLAPYDAFADFSERYGGDDGIFETLRGLHDDGALASDDLQFHTLTLRHDVAARRSGGAGTTEPEM